MRDNEVFFFLLSFFELRRIICGSLPVNTNLVPGIGFDS